MFMGQPIDSYLTLLSYRERPAIPGRAALSAVRALGMKEI